MRIVTVPIPKGLSYLEGHSHAYEFLGIFTVQVTPWRDNLVMKTFNVQWWSRQENKYADNAYAIAHIDRKRGVFFK